MESENINEVLVHGVSKALWKSLFHHFESIVKLNPWDWLGKHDFFGVQTDSKSGPVFIHFHESDSSDDPGLSMVFGWNAEALFRCVLSGIDHVPMRSYEIPLVRVYMRHVSELTAVEKDISDAAGAKTDAKGRVPVFVCYKPGWMPWILDNEDAEYCDAVLNQVFGILLRAETDKSIITRNDPLTVWVHTFDDKSKEWIDDWQRLHPLKEPVPGNKSMPSASLIGKINALPETLESVEADIDIIPKLALINSEIIKKCEGRRIPLGYLLAASDASSGSVGFSCIGNCVFYPCENISDMWNRIPVELFKFFLNAGKRPREIVVSSPLLMNFLRPLQTRIHFKLTYHEKLPKFAEVMERTRALVEDALKDGEYGHQ